MLAVGYNNGQTILCDVENAEKLHTIVNATAITTMSWISERPTDNVDKDNFQDRASFYLPKLPQFSKRFASRHHDI